MILYNFNYFGQLVAEVTTSSRQVASAEAAQKRSERMLVEERSRY
jgi:hypothetical protein